VAKLAWQEIITHYKRKYLCAMAAQLTIDIRPAEIDGKHYVSMSMDGREMKRHGPFPNADAAGAMAETGSCYTGALEQQTRPHGCRQRRVCGTSMPGLGRSLRNKL
jgi:hypothetical protein